MIATEVVTMTLDQIRNLRKEAEEDLARPLPKNPGGKAIRILVDPRSRKIIALCRELERVYELLEKIDTD